MATEPAKRVRMLARRPHCFGRTAGLPFYSRPGKLEPSRSR
jgi:hypothetical protein